MDMKVVVDCPDCCTVPKVMGQGTAEAAEERLCSPRSVVEAEV